MTVTDTGIGIAPADQERIFDSFQQGERSASTSTEGTGLGLTLERRIVELHGGRLWLESEPGEGSTFGFSHPAAAAPTAAADGPRLDGRRASDARPDRRRHRGRPAVGRARRACTSRAAGLRAVAASRPASEGLELVRAAATRRRSSSTSGCPAWTAGTCSRELKSDPATADMPVVVVASMPERGRGFALGAAEYLVKPVERRRTCSARCDAAAAAAARGRSEPRLRVVVVDDDPLALELVRGDPGAAGLGGAPCAGGEEGADLVRRDRPAVVVLDLLMPDVDGFAVIDAAPRRPATRRRPDRRADREDADAAGPRAARGPDRASSPRRPASTCRASSPARGACAGRARGTAEEAVTRAARRADRRGQPAQPQAGARRARARRLRVARGHHRRGGARAARGQRSRTSSSWTSSCPASTASRRSASLRGDPATAGHPGRRAHSVRHDGATASGPSRRGSTATSRSRSTSVSFPTQVRRHLPRATPRTAVTDGADAATGTVLVVDDLPQNVRLLRGGARAAGLPRASAALGRGGARARSRESRVDLVLLDILMPGMDGYEVCRAHPRGPRARLPPGRHGHGERRRSEKVRAIEAGADDFVTKPFDQAELLARVRSLVRVKRYHDTIDRAGRRARRAGTASSRQRVAEQVDRARAARPAAAVPVAAARRARRRLRRRVVPREPPPRDHRRCSATCAASPRSPRPPSRRR